MASIRFASYGPDTDFCQGNHLKTEISESYLSYLRHIVSVSLTSFWCSWINPFWFRSYCQDTDFCKVQIGPNWNSGVVFLTQDTLMLNICKVSKLEELRTQDFWFPCYPYYRYMYGRRGEINKYPNGTCLGHVFFKCPNPCNEHPKKPDFI